MKKILFSLLALFFLLTGCEKNETTAIPLDSISWTVNNTNITGTGDNVSTVIFFSDYSLSEANLIVPKNGETTSHTIVYSGNKATITVKTSGVNAFHIQYTYNSNIKSQIQIPTTWNSK